MRRSSSRRPGCCDDVAGIVTFEPRPGAAQVAAPSGQIASALIALPLSAWMVNPSMRTPLRGRRSPDRADVQGRHCRAARRAQGDLARHGDWRGVRTRAHRDHVAVVDRGHGAGDARVARRAASADEHLRRNSAGRVSALGRDGPPPSHPSPSNAFPSSHASPGSTWPLPHTTGVAVGVTVMVGVSVIVAVWRPSQSPRLLGPTSPPPILVGHSATVDLTWLSHSLPGSPQRTRSLRGPFFPAGQGTLAVPQPCYADAQPPRNTTRRPIRPIVCGVLAC